MNKVTIVVPIYNVSKYLDACITSIINQTFKDLEIILVNDGSKDNSLDICKKYSEFDSRIKILDKENGGLSSARNFGLDAATGEYILFLDGDDFLEQDTIEFALNKLEKNNAEILVFGVYNYYLETKSKYRLEKNNEDYEMVMNSDDALITMLNRELSFKWMACNKLYKRSLFNTIRYPIQKLYEDLGTTYKVIQKAKKIVYCSTPKYYYVQNPQSITKTFLFNEREMHRIEMCNDMYYGIKKNTINSELLNKLEVFRLSQYVSVLNVMIRSNAFDEHLVKDIRKMCRNSLYNIIIYANKKQKIQFLLLAISYNLYKVIFKNFIK